MYCFASVTCTSHIQYLNTVGSTTHVRNQPTCLLICYVSHFFRHTHAHYNNNYSGAIVPHIEVLVQFLYCSPILYWIVPREMCYISLSNESL